MKVGILNSSKAPQVTKTGIEGIQNQRNLVTVHSLMPTPLVEKKKYGNLKGTTTNAQHWSDLRKMPLHGNLALYRNDRQMHPGGA